MSEPVKPFESADEAEAYLTERTGFRRIALATIRADKARIAHLVEMQNSLLESEKSYCAELARLRAFIARLKCQQPEVICAGLRETERFTCKEQGLSRDQWCLPCQMRDRPEV